MKYVIVERVIEILEYKIGFHSTQIYTIWIYSNKK